MIPHRFAPVLSGLILSGLMTFIVSGISTLMAKGLFAGFVAQWMGAWMVTWVVAFPTILVMAPLTRKLVGRLVAKPAQPTQSA